MSHYDPLRADKSVKYIITEKSNAESAGKPLHSIPVPDDEYFKAYANGVAVAHTFFDFQFHFSEVLVRGIGEENISAETFASIMMSPQHAKAFLRHLSDAIRGYEAKFGEIKIPDQLIQETVNFELRTDAPQSSEPADR